MIQGTGKWEGGPVTTSLPYHHPGDHIALGHLSPIDVSTAIRRGDNYGPPHANQSRSYPKQPTSTTHLIPFHTFRRIALTGRPFIDLSYIVLLDTQLDITSTAEATQAVFSGSSMSAPNDLSSPARKGSMTSMTSSGSTYSRPAPYMVALSGWPEPVYISGGGPHRSSRATTPRASDRFGDIREGVDLSFSPTSPRRSARSREATPPPESIFSKVCVYTTKSDEQCSVPDHPRHLGKYSHHQARSPPEPSLVASPEPQPRQLSSEHTGQGFPTSSARGTPHPSPPASARHSPVPQLRPLLNSPHQYQQQQQQQQLHRRQSSWIEGQGSKYRSSFRDPRFAAHAAVSPSNVLRVAPSWSSSSTTATTSGPSTHQHQLQHQHQFQHSTMPDAQPTALGVRVPAGQRGTGLLITRAVPDVYPPPSSAPGIAGMVSNMTRDVTTGASNHGTGALGVATEVYPRDPNTSFLWGSGTVPSSARASRAGSVVSDLVKDEPSVKMEVDEVK